MRAVASPTLQGRVPAATPVARGRAIPSDGAGRRRPRRSARPAGGGASPARLDRADGPPLYQQLKERLREEIERGRWRHGEALPNEFVLARQYGLSSGTARRTIGALVEEGFLHRIQGLGTFIGPPQDRRIRRFFRFVRGFAQRPEVPESEVLSVEAVRPPLPARRLLRVGSRGGAVCITRLRRIDGQPVAFERSYFPQRRFPGLESLDFRGAIPYLVLEDHYGVVVHRAEEFLRPIPASPEDRARLGCGQGAPLLLIERITYSIQNDPIEYRVSRARMDRYRYFVEIR